MSSGEYKGSENEDIENSDESDRPSGERWAPVGANDGDNDFADEYKYVDNMENLPYDMERLKVLEEEQEMLNSSLIALTTHFAQVQFRLRQIVDAPANEKETLLKELEEFAFRGIPDVPNNLSLDSRSITPTSPMSCKQSISGVINDIDIESKMALQRTKQKELICQLKSQLEDLEKYAYETGDADLPQSMILERQNIIINHLKEKLNFNVDDLCKLPVDDLRWQVDYAISQIVSPLKMKEQLVSQLKTQIADLERFINYLQGEVSTETLACTCACPVHTNSAGSTSYAKKSFNRKTDEENRTKTLNTVKKVVALLHMFLVSQLGCGSERVRRNFKKNSIHNWRDLRTRLDIAVEHVIETIAEVERHPEDDDIANEDDYASDSDSMSHCNARVTSAVRKHLATSIRDLIQHGLMSDARSNSVVPFVGCFPQRNSSTSNLMHAWELILKYYEIKNGHHYNSSPAQKLSQSFNLDLAGGRVVSSKQSLLTTIGNIIASHSPYKRSYDSHFKAFICASLNTNKLVIWLKLILQCQYLLENHYTSWSYVIKTGFQDAFHTLDRLTSYKFDLPVDLAKILPSNVGIIQLAAECAGRNSVTVFKVNSLQKTEDKKSMQAFLKTGKLGPGEFKKVSNSRLKEERSGPAPPWVEKYRPKNVEDVVEQTEVVEVLRQCLKGGDFPNLLFYGPPGTGKTSTILAAARQLFGSLYKERVLELNASDERGIQVVREKIKSFAQLTAGGIRDDGKSCPPFKIIVLDEADSMTGAAQAALRRTMEKESHSTRFCLICNYVSRIIEPLTSRCTKFRFKPLGENKIIERLEYICKEEDLKVEKPVLLKIVEVSGGDLRRAITCLQSITKLKGKGIEITVDDVLEIIGIVPDKWLDELIDVCKTKDYSKAEEFVDQFMLEAYATSQVIEQLSERIIYSNELTDKQKALIADTLGECNYRLLDGGNEYIQLINICCGIIRAYELV